ncbi:MAG: cytochrome P450 [Gammaproteobacteria bacterium]|nr:cytochrome P450 [Gammaproteobacteria bacterium]
MVSEKDYLREYDAAVKEQKYLLVQKWIREEPLPFFKQLRAERPVLETPEYTLVALFTDVRDMLQMPRVFTVDLYKPKMGVTGPDEGYLMAHDDNALHYREKSLMQGLLNRKDLPRIRRLVEKAAKEILDQAGGKIEVINEYCRMVPVHLVQDYFGLDCIDKAKLIEWSYWNQYDAFNNQPFDMLTKTERQTIVDKHNAVTVELSAYIASLITRKLITTTLMKPINLLTGPFRWMYYKLTGKTPISKDDMVSRMLNTKFASEVDFSLVRVGVNVGGLLIGAIETTSQAVAHVIEFFIDRKLLKEARDCAIQSDLGAFDDMVWEALRFVPIRSDIFRKAASDYTIAKGAKHQTTIKEGTIVRLLIHSAMFDTYAYENPDNFSPERNFDHNFIFGYGQHECLGKYVGIEMVPEMVRQVIMRDNLKSLGKISYRSELFNDRDGPFPEKFELKWSS